eukprot:scaffold14084_cov140-Isochrysis_galbana.AAC.3
MEGIGVGVDRSSWPCLPCPRTPCPWKRSSVPQLSRRSAASRRRQWSSEVEMRLLGTALCHSRRSKYCSQPSELMWAGRSTGTTTARRLARCRRASSTGEVCDSGSEVPDGP